MPTCIYCLEQKPATAFLKREHVLPASFGAFEPDNLVLHEVVCDACNERFGNTIELYLARDTPDGLNRYLMGGKDPAEFKSLGKRSTLVHRADSGPLKGARLAHRPNESVLELAPLPQVAFGTVDGGPYERWFLAETLPSREELQQLKRDGYQFVHLCGIVDVEPVLAVLRERGCELGDMKQTTPAGWRTVVRVETLARLEMPFGRAITKIALNYLAHEYGASVALMAQFNIARQFALRGGRAEERRIWTVLPLRQGTLPLGHTISLEWNRQERSVTAGTSRSTTRLCTGCCSGQTSSSRRSELEPTSSTSRP